MRRFLTRQEAIDQAAHFAAAAAILVAFAFGGMIGAGLAGLGIGLVREVSESGTPVRWANIRAHLGGAGAQIDLLFWTLGGLVAGLLS